MPLSPQTIEKISNSPEGQEIKEFLLEEMEKLDRISDIPDDWVESQKAIEVTARKRAAAVLSMALSPLISFQERKETDTSGREYGL